MVYSSAYACRELSIDSQISVRFNYTCGNDLSKLLIWDGSNYCIVKLWINFRALFTYALPCEERIYLGRSKSEPPPATYTYACINL